ncbi:MAG TPA: hypothetical protein PJ997_01280 [Candidatus Paceibacterota bacterium]|nr:hypothetical protein [Candidatus Paceibacterota bacterium]HMP18955.1 hypothetical protein [Candidatus Paceibacterota bacterium]HMP85448.1 hypothetical protein [Candidatus Paceibacterota bacterium]
MTFENPQQKVEVVKMPQALKKARELMAEYRTNMNDFSDLYDPRAIESDKKYVAEMKARFSISNTELHEKINNELAEVFETIIFDEGESANWFGENAFLIKTSEFDDIKNGIDMVVEYDEEEGVSRLAAAIDVTFGHNVTRKIDRIKQEILSGKLGTVKYFISQVANIRGEITRVPRIIIGADVDSVRGLVNEWVEKNSSHFAKHPIQFQIFDQAVLQCDYFADFARENGQEEIAQAYDAMKKVLERNRKDREGQVGEDPHIRDSFMVDFVNYIK